MAENFQVTARKWRPMRFDDVVGQDHVTRTLKNAIREKRLAHAYLFTGQRGCGKTTVARILAKAINCPNAAKNDFEPCNECDICLSITEGRSMDVSEIDGASNNGVDDVRSLRDNVKYPPLQGEHKVIIIDEVHMLSTSAFNALLKTLEEPPKHLVFVFATTEVQKVLPTILSRTQRYDFRRLQLDEITGRLRFIADADGIAIDDEALLIVAKKADGSMRDAQSIFDQVVAFCGHNVDTDKVREALNLIDTDFFFEVTDAIQEQAAAKAFELGHHIISRGYDIEEFFIGLMEHFRNILTVLITQSVKFVEVSKSHQERYVNVAQDFSEGDLLRLIRLGTNALERLKVSQQPRIVLEVTLTEMMLMERALELKTLLTEIRSSKSSLPENIDNSSRVSQPGGSEQGRGSSRSECIINELRKTAIEPEYPAAAAPRSAQSSVALPPSVKKNSQPVVTQAAMQEVEAAATIDLSILERSWDDFVQQVASVSRPLYMAMDDVTYCGSRKNVVFLGVSENHTGEILIRFKDIFQQQLRAFCRAPNIVFEVGAKNEMIARSGMTVVEKPEVVEQAINSMMEQATSAVKPSRGNAQRTPLEQALIQEFHAQEI